MITKIALVSRLAPGLFRRLPMVVRGGYAMPKGRFFIAGASFSAALHAAVFFGIPAPTPIELPEPIKLTPPAPLTPEEVALLALPSEPKEDEGKDSKDKDRSDEKAEEAKDFRRLPDPIARPLFNDTAIAVAKPEIGSAGSGTAVWDVPRYTEGPRGRSKDDMIVLLEDLDDRPVSTRSVAPRYPSELKRDGVGGTVLLRFVVDSRGNVVDPMVVKSEYAEFGKAAIDAILRWEFKPGRKNGRSVSTLMEIPMVFSSADPRI